VSVTALQINNTTAQGHKDLPTIPAPNTNVTKAEVPAVDKQKITITTDTKTAGASKEQQVQDKKIRAEVERRINDAARQVSNQENKKLLDAGNSVQLRYNEKIDMRIVEIVDSSGRRVGTLPPDGFVQLKEKLIAMSSAVGNLINKRG